MRLTIVFDDLSLPLPPMQTPDVRQRIIEQVLEMAHEALTDLERREKSSAGAQSDRRHGESVLPGL